MGAWEYSLQPGLEYCAGFKRDMAGLAGGIVGGIVALVVLGMVAFFLWRRRQRRRLREAGTMQEAEVAELESEDVKVGRREELQGCEVEVPQKEQGKEARFLAELPANEEIGLAGRVEMSLEKDGKAVPAPATVS